MRISVLQHVHFEGPAAIAGWATARGHGLHITRLDLGQPLPSPDGVDALVVMGGPMSVNDEEALLWLRPEKLLVRSAIDAGRPVLGVCLGAQLIASAMGQRVYGGAEKEIGWFPVRRVSEAGVAGAWPAEFTPLHWHGETFDLPPGAQRLAETDVTPNQAFQLGRRVVGLQFHIEATPASLQQLIDHAADEIGVGRYQQSPQAMLAQVENYTAMHGMLYDLLDQLTA